MLEYYHADRLEYAVAGTPNRLEYDLGFFVRNGDGAADLEGRGQPGRELHDLVIEQRGAHFERAGHAHPVHLDQDVVGQPGLEVHVEHPRERIGVAHPIEVPGEARERIVVTDLGEEFRGAERALLLVEEQQHVVEIGALE